MRRYYKRFCPAGHDKAIVGVTVKRQCRECKREEDRRREQTPYQREARNERRRELARDLPEAQREQRRRYTVAYSRAALRLVKMHRNEFSSLFAEEFAKADHERIVGVQLVPEHERYLYGRAEARE
jgi:hypothetical protein